MKRSTVDAGMAIFVIVVFLAVLAGVTHKAKAHDWYTGLKNDEGYYCCDKHDFKPVRAWQDDRGIWHALYPDKDGNETEYVIPPEVILPDEFNLEPFQAHLAIVNGLPRCFLRKGAGG